MIFMDIYGLWMDDNILKTTDPAVPGRPDTHKMRSERTVGTESWAPEAWKWLLTIKTL